MALRNNEERKGIISLPKKKHNGICYKVQDDITRKRFEGNSLLGAFGMESDMASVSVCGRVEEKRRQGGRVL